jgi:tripartite-type tricarboxylate transporter receptor subunit TctC
MNNHSTQIPRIIFLISIYCLLDLRIFSIAHAQANTKKSTISMPIRLIVPNAPSGPTDTVARIVGQKLAEKLKGPVIIDNRPGASGTVGGDIVFKSAPNGRTLLLVSSSAFVSTPILVPQAPYDGRRDFNLITAVVSVPYLLLVNPSIGLSSVREFISYARSKPNALNYGSAGTGSTSHLVAALFTSAAKINALHIPYKGSALAAMDLIGGQLQFEFEAVAGGMQHIKSGRLRALGISSTKRLDTLPDLATIAESGLPSFEAIVTHGICATAKTPTAIISELNKAITNAIQTADTKERLIAIGAFVIGNSPAEYRAMTEIEIKRWDKIVREIASKDIKIN